MNSSEKIIQIRLILANPELDEIEILSKIRRCILSRELKIRYSLEEIERQVIDYFHITVEELNSKTRKSEIVMARQFAHYKASRFTILSDKKIGAYFGGKDHSTTLYSIKKIAGYLDIDEEFKQKHETFLNN